MRKRVVGPQHPLLPYTRASVYFRRLWRLRQRRRRSSCRMAGGTRDAVSRIRRSSHSVFSLSSSSERIRWQMASLVSLDTPTTWRTDNAIFSTQIFQILLNSLTVVKFLFQRQIFFSSILQSVFCFCRQNSIAKAEKIKFYNIKFVFGSFRLRIRIF